MSLRIFHIVFIVASILLSAMFGVWSLQHEQPAAAATAFGLVALLVLYGIWFVRKVRTQDEERRRRRKLIHPLPVAMLAWVWASGEAHACSVCYGEAAGPMIDAAKLGVWLLFGLVFAVQLAFVLFFLYLRKQARLHGGSQHGLTAAELPGGVSKR